MQELHRDTFGDWALCYYEGGQSLFKDGLFVSANFGPDLETYQRAADQMFGEVYITGMGLGTLPTMLSLNPNVIRVVVCEIDPVLYSWHLQRLPPKVELILGDARFHIPLGKFDFAFHDIWGHERIDAEEALLHSRVISTYKSTFFNFQETGEWQ